MSESMNQPINLLKNKKVYICQEYVKLPGKDI